MFKRKGKEKRKQKERHETQQLSSEKFENLNRSDWSSCSPPPRCSVPPARALLSSKSSHRSAFSFSVSACLSVEDPSSLNVSVCGVRPPWAWGGEGKEPIELDRLCGRVVDALLSPPEDFRSPPPAVLSSSPREGDVTRLEGAETWGPGRCGLLEGRGGGGGTPSRCGCCSWLPQGGVEGFAHAHPGLFLIENVLIASAVENSGMIGDSERPAGFSAGGPTRALRCFCSLRGGNGREGSSSEGDCTIVHSSSRGTPAAGATGGIRIPFVTAP